ncbi:Molecular chaperone (DnaJ superfamily) [Phytophthora cinnamomi]|uniref:Molecular chaperone (DnaJ superfamily) n=1 Tax=Phytophthora cinnamomi TaxID=4785 RepID=UPI0035596A86|nr:Molecular chaperone (DnaJ superfamily) [Phytophthora cinnamomi]
MAKAGGGASIETLASGAIAAGCLQAVMNMVHPELVRFVAFQRERVARRDAEQEQERSAQGSSRYFRRRPEPADAAAGADAPSAEQQTDLSFQLKFLRRHWHSHLRALGLDPELPAVVQRALLYRNKVAHQSQLSLAQYEHAIATFEKLADIIECNALIRQQIRELVTKLLSFSPLGKKQAAAQAESELGLQESKAGLADPVALEPMPPPASLEQILQHNYLYDGDENEDPLWVELKLIGNDYFKEENYTEAIEAYSQALDVAPNQAVLFGNRAMCYLRLKEFECAREDAEDALDADSYENVKYYRLLSEAMMGMKDYDEAKEICDEGLELDPKDATLLSRRRTAQAIILKEKAEYEKEKKRKELEERAKVEAANAAAAAQASANAVKERSKSGKGKTNKKKHKLKNASPEIELVPMINYQEVPAKWIEIHTRGSRRLEIYQAGMENLVIAAKALLQVTDSIGTPGRALLPLDDLVEEGMIYLRKAGEAGVAEAWFRLGVLYSSNVRKGMPLIADPHKMMDCFHKAAALRPFIKPPGNRVFPHQGVAEAENELGVCYRDGIPAPVVEADLKKAFHFFLRAAEHDHPVGQYNVAVAYSTGSGTPVDAFAARMWTSRAAQHGLPEAQQYLAQLFEKGYGGRRDERQAREWTMTACQNRLTDIMMKHDFADVGVTVAGGGDIANKFTNNPTVSQRGKEVLQEFYDAYLDETGNDSGPDFSVGVVTDDDDDIQITKVSSYTPSATSSSDHFVRPGIYRPHSAVIDAEIQGRAKAGGALRNMKRADLMWERPKSVFTTGAGPKELLAKVLKEAAVSFQINPRDIDAAYVIGRWDMMSDQDIVLHWKRCVKMHPNEASFHFYLGTAYLTLQHYNDAMDSIEAALAIEKKPDWLYWFAAPMIGLGMIDPALSVYKEYVDTNPPDERFIPDAYYSIGALYFKKYDNAMATVYHELGQMAESVAIRFPAFYPKVLFDTAKETLRSGMKKNGYMESSVIASVMAQNMIECGFCKTSIKPTQLLSHKLSKCPRRTVVCEHCDDRMVFDALQAHQQSRHAVAGKSKKKKGKAVHG